MATVAVAAEEEENSVYIQKQLTNRILLADGLIIAAEEATFFDLSRQATQLSHLLRAVARLSATQTLYDRPIRRITSEVSKTLDRALIFIRKNKRSNILRHVFSITTNADIRKVTLLIENSIADIKWLLSIFDSDSGTVLSLPPIASSSDPIIAWVWSYIASIQSGLLKNRIGAAQELSSLAQLNDRNKNTIIEENGIPPLLNLLKETTSPDAQIASADAIYHLANNQGRARLIAEELGVQTIVKALNESPSVRVQLALVKLVSRLAELDRDIKEEFGLENVTRALVTLLDMGEYTVGKNPLQLPRKNVTSLRSLVEVAKNKSYGSFSGSSNSFTDAREMESPEVISQLKVSCAKALCILAKWSLSNAQKITTETALKCLAKIIEKEKGDLQIHCLNTVMELAMIAEGTSDLRTAFKSPDARALLEQLLQLLHNEREAKCLIPSIKVIGCLARTFPAKDTRVIQPLVAKLEHDNHEIATQAVIALTKFVNPDNFNSVDFSKAIVEFNGVVKVMNLMRIKGRNQSHEFLLLCILAVNVGNNEAFEQARALSILEGAARHVVPHNPKLRELYTKAIHHLTLYQTGTHTHRIQID